MNGKKYGKLLLDLALMVLLALMYQKTVISMHFHETGGLVLMGLFFLHKALNWKWIRGVTAGIFRRFLRILASVVCGSHSRRSGDAPPRKTEARPSPAYSKQRIDKPRAAHRSSPQILCRSDSRRGVRRAESGNCRKNNKFHRIVCTSHSAVELFYLRIKQSMDRLY